MPQKNDSISEGFQELTSQGQSFCDEDDPYEGNSKGGQQEDYVSVESIDGYFVPPFVDDIYEFAKECIQDFFADKDSYRGGSFGEDDKIKQTCEESLSIVVNTSVSAATMTAYAGIDEASWINSIPPQDGIPADDVRLWISILNACARRGVPKYFAGGVALLCLEHCEGVNVPYDRIAEFQALEEGWTLEYDEDDSGEDDDDFDVSNYVIDDGLPR